MRPRNATKTRIMVIVICLVLTVSTFATADDQANLAKESQNPIGNIISLPFENNFDFGVGEADSDDRWTVPVGGGVGKLIRFGKQPVDIIAQGFVNAVKPDGAADWSLQVQVKLLFPKQGPKAGKKTI